MSTIYELLTQNDILTPGELRKHFKEYANLGEENEKLKKIKEELEKQNADLIRLKDLAIVQNNHYVAMNIRLIRKIEKLHIDYSTKLKNLTYTIDNKPIEMV